MNELEKIDAAGGTNPLGVARAVLREVTLGAATQTVSVTQRVVDGARDGEPAARLAATAASSWLRFARDVLDLMDHGLAALTDGTNEAVPPAPRGGTRGRGVLDELVDRRSEPTRSRNRRSVPLRADAPPAADDGEDLRRAGRDLLRRSTAMAEHGDHPAFRALLQEIAPDEARILRELYRSGPQAVVDVVEHDSMRKTATEVARHVSLVANQAGCNDPERVALYLDNLARLGLVHLRDYAVVPADQYELLEAQPAIDGLPRPKRRFVRNKLLHKGVELSEFGRSLYEACFDDGEIVIGHDGVVERASD